METRRTGHRHPSQPPVRRHKIEQRLPAEVLDHLVRDYRSGDKTPALAKRYGITRR